MANTLKCTSSGEYRPWKPRCKLLQVVGGREDGQIDIPVHSPHRVLVGPVGNRRSTDSFEPLVRASQNDARENVQATARVRSLPGSPSAAPNASCSAHLLPGTGAGGSHQYTRVLQSLQRSGTARAVRQYAQCLGPSIPVAGMEMDAALPDLRRHS